MSKTKNITNTRHCFVSADANARGSLKIRRERSRFRSLPRPLKAWESMLLFAIIAVALPGWATVSPEEMARKEQWVRKNLLTASNPPPFSFTYAGQPWPALLASGQRLQRKSTLDTNRIQHVLTWTNNSLQVKCVAVEYNDYPLVEWTVYLKAVGSQPTALLEGIQGLDTTFSRPKIGPEFVLRGIKGDWTTADSYEPYQVALNPLTVTNFSPLSYSGKSSSGPTGWPYSKLPSTG